jgi:hypothetical protein
MSASWKHGQESAGLNRQRSSVILRLLIYLLALTPLPPPPPLRHHSQTTRCAPSRVTSLAQHPQVGLAPTTPHSFWGAVAPSSYGAATPATYGSIAGSRRPQPPGQPQQAPWRSALSRAKAGREGAWGRWVGVPLTRERGGARPVAALAIFLFYSCATGLL